MINLILKLMDNEALKTAFLKLANMSISASWLVLVILVLRLVLQKAPKWINVLLWGIVAVRLTCPFTIESALSLIPSTQTIPMNIEMAAKPAIDSGVAVVNSMVNPMIAASFTPNPSASANPLQIWIPLAAVIWAFGMALMLLYTAISYWRLNRRIDTAVLYRDNIFQNENVSSPFVLGIIKPKIYLPFHMNEQDLQHVVAHEQAHIRRKDHWWKPFGFLLLTIHWFNPLMWLAYALLCRDIELACDEKVIKELNSEQRADYTQALVACSVNRRMISVCPLAFGEVGVKDRVKSIMNYRKPAFWIIVTALVVCVVVSVCFLTDPNPSRESFMSGDNVSNLNPEAIVERIMDIENIDNSGVYTNSMNFPLQVDSDFNWADSQAVNYFFVKSKTTYKGQLRILPDEEKYFLTKPSEGEEQQSTFLLLHYLEAIKYLPQEAIRQMAPADQYIIQQWEEGIPSDYERVITYSCDAVQPIDGWYIHLQIQPLHADGDAFRGTGEEVVDLFYGSSNGKYSDYAEMWFDFTAAAKNIEWTDKMKRTMNEFPGITFKYTPYEIVASTSWEDNDTAERTVLISGMPIWNAYFSDLTGDGLPEICSQVSFGSGIIDSRVIIYDYASGVSYNLIDRGNYDYYLRMNDADGYLYVDKRLYNSIDVVSSGRLVFKDGCIQIEGITTEPASLLRAKILEIHDGYFLVEAVEGSWELSSASKIEVSMTNMAPSPEPKVGDILEIEYDGQLAETYPARISNPYRISVIEEKETWDRIPMVMVNGTLYLDTGKESTIMARCGMMDGEITSQVDGSEEPTIDDQSNFGTGYGYQYGAIEGTIEIKINGKWWIFATEEARKEIQFPAESTESETPDMQKVEEYLTDYTINQVKSRLTKTDMNILSITDHYALVHVFDENPELIVYHYVFDNITKRVNITGIVRGDFEPSTEFSINHFQMDNQHVYFGTIEMTHGHPIENVLSSTENLSMKFIGKTGETFETYIQDNSYYLTTLESPLENIEILDNEKQVLWDLDAYLNQGYAIQEKSMLIAALGTNGTRGFVKAEDLEGDLPSNPEEAIAYMEEMERKTAYGTKKYVRMIPLYAEDGVTVIGEFAIG